MTFKRRGNGFGDKVFKAVAITSASLLFIFMILMVISPCPDTHKQSIDIGEQPSLAEGERAAIRALSYELENCPFPSSRTVVWTLDSGNECYIRYWDNDFILSPNYTATSWKNVREEAIHAVAAKNGPIKDLELHGARSEQRGKN